ncbi:ABC transporter ATP-binding protein [Microbacterium koreense]|uniref:ABC transporter ATP-binding protein n=1 Tax=Microbacterium koreense TaxID=323761 RepID=A0ABW2ZML3_9MICO
MSLLRARGLTLVRADGRSLVEGVDLDIDEGQTLAVVGPSGAGKSSLAWALGRMLPRGVRLQARLLEVDEVDVLRLSRGGVRRFRRHDFAVVPQDPLRALNPTSRIAAHVADVMPPDAPRDAVFACLAEVGLAEPEQIARRFPREISGGQAQRVLLAMALARRPRLLVLDEPTSGLDGRARIDAFAAVRRLQQSHGTAVMLISHDQDVVADHADRVAKLEDGRVVEVPKPSGPARPLRVRAEPACDRGYAARRDVRTPPSADAGGALVEVSALRVVRGGRSVLDGISLRIAPGEIVGLTGPSGSGKTTLARAITGLIDHDGAVLVRAPDRPPPVQMVWQSPASSLNPRRTVRQTLRRAVTLLNGGRTVSELLEMVGLGEDIADGMPHELSGGQQQRVALARAFAGRAALVVCDEPTSSLDSHARDAVLSAIAELRTSTGTACLFISHDQEVLRRVADRVVHLREGRLVDTVSTW